MSDWHEKAEDPTVGRGYWSAAEAWAHVAGARWQREALLSDEAVERAARALVPQIWRLRDEGYESETHKQQVERSLLIARTVLTEALGEDEQ